MSKAFTRESDDLPDIPVYRPSSPLPPGAKNYMTPDGAKRFRDELDHKIQVERPQAVSLQGQRDSKARLQILDQRILQLQQILQSAQVADPQDGPLDRVRFGASVMVREGNGNETPYRIVGVDETDIDRGWVSWLSPIAKALLNKKVGDRVRFRFPSGEEELEILNIQYEATDPHTGPSYS